MYRGDYMNFIISRSPDGTKSYPLHRHSNYEISFCLENSGILTAQGKNYPFSKGCIVIIPPDTEHSSRSDTELDCIYLRGDFSLLFNTAAPLVLRDNAFEDGRQLATMIYNNRFSNAEFVSSLCDAYIHFILINMKTEDNIGKAVTEIVEKLTTDSSDANLSTSKILAQSGYAEDYIRSHFLRITGKTPTSFLTDIRMRNACFLMETYNGTLALSQIAERCGYNNYTQFSKKFKAYTGVSPRCYAQNKSC